MLDFRDLLDGVDVTKNHPSDDEDVGGDANDRTKRDGFFFFFFFFSRFSEARFWRTTATDATDATDATEMR
jgi:hypothetical protein